MVDLRVNLNIIKRKKKATRESYRIYIEGKRDWDVINKCNLLNGTVSFVLTVPYICCLLVTYK